MKSYYVLLMLVLFTLGCGKDKDVIDDPYGLYKEVTYEFEPGNNVASVIYTSLERNERIHVPDISSKTIIKDKIKGGDNISLFMNSKVPVSGEFNIKVMYKGRILAQSDKLINGNTVELKRLIQTPDF